MTVRLRPLTLATLVLAWMTALGAGLALIYLYVVTEATAYK